MHDIAWVKGAVSSVVLEQYNCGKLTYGLSGMASGVDLWFCQACLENKIPYCACPPFEEQNLEMKKDEAIERSLLIEQASAIKKVRNSWMVENCDGGIVVWNGGKGGTHNVVEQLVEKNKPFVWINPVGKKIWWLD